MIVLIGQDSKTTFNIFLSFSRALELVIDYYALVQILESDAHDYDYKKVKECQKD
jgi:hypothetical protein